MSDAVADLVGRTATVYTVSGTRWVGRVDHIVATSTGDPSAVAVTLENGDGDVVVPWHAITEIVTDPS